jgi:subtilisin family serine protease
MSKILLRVFLSIIIIAGFLVSCALYEENMLTATSKLETEKQWYIDNDGQFDINLSKFDAWENDSFKCVPNVDIDWIDKFANIEPKRECIVAVIDTGFDISHEAFKNTNIVYNSSPDGAMESIHGTGVLSALCGDSKYIKSPLSGTKIKILPVVAIDEEDGAQFDAVVDAIKYAEEQGSDICNLSIESYIDNAALRETIKESNMLFCVSAGNGGYNLDDVDNEVKVYPACYDFSNVITVADVRCDGYLSKQSNYGELNTDISAPGTDIIVAYPGGGYEYMSGTSIATPLVTGIAALIYTYSNQELDSSELKSTILASSKRINNLDGKVACSGIVSMALAWDGLEK